MDFNQFVVNLGILAGMGDKLLREYVQDWGKHAVKVNPNPTTRIWWF